MENFLTLEMYDAYIEMCLGVMTLRIPQVQTILINNYPVASIESSYINLTQQHINLNVKNIIADIKAQGLVAPKGLRAAFSEINKIFLVSTWEILKDTNTYNTIATEPDIQFFRHIRNGCAHNKFNFTDLRHPAKWRDKEINTGLIGTAVFPSFIKDGDPILLLIDINNKYYNRINITGYVPYVP
jgi:hypothetical protein